MTELMELPEINPVTVFTKEYGSKIVIDSVRKQVESLVLDASTEEGRAKIKSVAYIIAKRKNDLDKAGKELKDEITKQGKVIDAERNKIWNALEEMQTEVRRPVTEFENREKARVDGHKNLISEITSLAEQCSIDKDLGTLRSMQERLHSILEEHDFEEFKAVAEMQYQSAFEKISAAMDSRKKYEDDQFELQQLRQKQLEQEQKDRDAKIAEAARLQAEQAAQAAIAAAEERAKKAEMEKALADRKAEQDAAAAVSAERARVAAQEAAIAAENIKREQDKNHKAKINNEVLNGIIACVPDLTPEQAKAIVVALATKKIPHVQITY